MNYCINILSKDDNSKAIFRTSNLTTYDITTEFMKIAKQKESKEA